MAVPFLVWIIVGVVTILALLALLIGLVRHLLVLFRSLGEFRQAVTPVAEELTAEANRASDRAARLSSERPFGRS
jgi:dolichol kinase